MAAANQQTQAFYDGLTNPGDIDGLVRDAQEEGLYLEFKRKAREDRADLDDGDRTAFSKSLSGFANADGGVLIFGVETNTGEHRIDRAVRVRPIADVETFCGRLRSSILNTTQPPVDGVSISHIANANGSGFAKVLIPPSERPPHRAMSQGAAREYWLRTSDGVRRMEHYELEAVFGRRLRPVLKIKIGYRQAQLANGRMGSELEFHFLNVGRGVAKYAGFVCFVTSPGASIGVRRAGVGDLSNVNGRSAVGYTENDGVIHANEIYAFLGAAEVRGRDGAPVDLHVVWYAENMMTRRHEVQLQLGDVVEI